MGIAIAVLRWIAWAGTQAWRWGASKVSKAIAWARRNWRTVKRWLDAGLSFATIMELILRALGLA